MILPGELSLSGRTPEQAGLDRIQSCQLELQRAFAHNTIDTTAVYSYLSNRLGVEANFPALIYLEGDSHHEAATALQIMTKYGFPTGITPDFSTSEYFGVPHVALVKRNKSLFPQTEIFDSLRSSALVLMSGLSPHPIKPRYDISAQDGNDWVFVGNAEKRAIARAKNGFLHVHDNKKHSVFFHGAIAKKVAGDWAREQIMQGHFPEFIAAINSKFKSQLTVQHFIESDGYFGFDVTVEGKFTIPISFAYFSLSDTAFNIDNYSIAARILDWFEAQDPAIIKLLIRARLNEDVSEELRSRINATTGTSNTYERLRQVPMDSIQLAQQHIIITGTGTDLEKQKPKIAQAI